MPRASTFIPLAIVIAVVLGTRSRAVGYREAGDMAQEPVTPSIVDTTRTAAAWLSALPDGETKRRFLLDCAGCHQFDERIAHPGGAPRSRESWIQRTEQMLAFAGASTSFPVMAPARDAASTAAWLVEHVPATPPDEVAPAEPPAGIEVDAFELPRPMDLPHDLAVDPDGRVVITGMFSHVLYVLDPATGAFEEVPIPVPDANPRAIEIEPDGTWWVVLGAPQKVARRDPDGGWTSWDLGMYPHEVALDAQGRVWFNGHFTKEPELMGYLDPATGATRTFEVPVPTMPDGGTTIPYGLRVGPDGTVWMTELVGGRLVEFDPATETFELHPLPTPYSGPRRLDVAPDGTVWIPEFANNRLARFDPGSGRFSEYELPTPDALPYVARVDARTGAVWVATAAADLVARFDPDAETFVEVPLPRPKALVRHLAIDPRTGAVWAPYGAAPPTTTTILRLRPR